MKRRTFLTSAAIFTAAVATGLRGGPDPAFTGGLAGHRIKSVETQRVPLLWPRFVGKNAKRDVHGRGPTATVVVLHTDDSVSRGHRRRAAVLDRGAVRGNGGSLARAARVDPRQRPREQAAGRRRAEQQSTLLERLEQDGILHVRLNDIVGLGFTAWRALMPQLAARGTLASPHAWGSGLKTVCTAHLTAALGNVPTIEGVTCSDSTVDFGGNVLRDGRFQVSNQPGFGLRLQ
jgi:hypothetical protein